MFRKRLSMYLGVAVISLVAILLIASPLLAAPASYIEIIEFNTNECTPGTYADGLVLFVRGTATDVFFSLENRSKGTSTSWTTTGFPPDGYAGFDVEVPTQTERGDKMLLTMHFENASGYTVAEDTVSYRCGGGAGKPYTGINLLSEAEQAPYLSVPTAEGALPCGVFDVNGWGAKYVGMADFPACTAPVTVMCLNSDGAWTAENVSNVVMQGDYEVDFTSSQHGLCALFD